MKYSLGASSSQEGGRVWYTSHCGLVFHTPQVYTMGKCSSSIHKACQPNKLKPSVQNFLWCVNRKIPKALMWPQPPPKVCPTVVPWILLWENTAWDDNYYWVWKHHPYVLILGSTTRLKNKRNFRKFGYRYITKFKDKRYNECKNIIRQFHIKFITFQSYTGQNQKGAEKWALMEYSSQ